jgi:hypothetical protein
MVFPEPSVYVYSSDLVEDERYEWRTVDGLSKQIGILEAKVPEVLAGLA